MLSWYECLNDVRIDAFGPVKRTWTVTERSLVALAVIKFKNAVHHMDQDILEDRMSSVEMQMWKKSLLRDRSVNKCTQQ